MPGKRKGHEKPRGKKKPRKVPGSIRAMGIDDLQRALTDERFGNKRLEKSDKIHRNHIKTLSAANDRLEGRFETKATIAKTRKALAGVESPEDLKVTKAEALFVNEALERGYKIFRNGWPDFLVVNPETGRYRFVEVKSRTDRLSDYQISLFAALEGIGIEVEVFRAWKTAGNRSVHWRVLAGLPVEERESLDGAGTSQAVMVGLRAKSRPPRSSNPAVTALRWAEDQRTGECGAE